MASARHLGWPALIACAVACSQEPEIQERPLLIYSPRSCPVSQSQAFSIVYAAGDFEPSADAPPIASLFLRDVGTVMGELPPSTRSIVVDISQPSQSVDWRGMTEIPSTGPINVLVWPGGESCRLTRNVEPRDNVVLGAFGRHVIVVGGTSSNGQVPRTFVGDLAMGLLEPLALGLRAPRANASVTAFRQHADEDPSPALVAGGQDPSTGAPIDTAEIYVPKPGTPGDIGDFDRTRIVLSRARTKHGSVVLATGETLLVGGIDPSGLPTPSLEVVDPFTREVRTERLTQLEVPRHSPTVLRLASGEILIAGGFDRLGEPVPTLEWLSPDASRKTKRSVNLVAGKQRAFVPLAAGGALAVVSPKDPVPDFKTVWVISAEGSLDPGLPVAPATLTDIHLFAGTEGSPVLFTGNRWLRWVPWYGAFQAIADAPSSGPMSNATLNGDAGLALWLESVDATGNAIPGTNGASGLYVRGYRFATRTRFDSAPNPMLVSSPAGLAPDRLPGLPGSAIRFTPEEGLILGTGASTFVTDTTFANFVAELDVVGAAPIVVMRNERGEDLDIGGQACAFGQTATKTLRVERSGKTIIVRSDNGDPRTCPVELDKTARFSVGLRGTANIMPSGARNFRVVRR